MFDTMTGIYDYKLWAAIPAVLKLVGNNYLAKMEQIQLPNYAPVILTIFIKSFIKSAVIRLQFFSQYLDQSQHMTLKYEYRYTLNTEIATI